MKAVYRNLPLAKKDPRRFVWSVGSPGIKANGEVKTGGVGKAPEHRTQITLKIPSAVIKPRLLSRPGRRDVGAWIVGEATHETIPGTRRAFTLNPVELERGGRLERVFYYCTIIDGQLVIQEPVEFSAVLAVEFTPTGAFAILRE